MALSDGLNRTFYGIETRLGKCYRHESFVLIVPFMELKQVAPRLLNVSRKRLNRTFYGIETKGRIETGVVSLGLNRTFYGIETPMVLLPLSAYPCLNRTFYGIETSDLAKRVAELKVLIVPFMELKHVNGYACF